MSAPTELDRVPRGRYRLEADWGWALALLLPMAAVLLAGGGPIVRLSGVLLLAACGWFARRMRAQRAIRLDHDGITELRGGEVLVRHPWDSLRSVHVSARGATVVAERGGVVLPSRLPRWRAMAYALDEAVGEHAHDVADAATVREWLGLEEGEMLRCRPTIEGAEGEWRADSTGCARSAGAGGLGPGARLPPSTKSSMAGASPR